MTLSAHTIVSATSFIDYLRDPAFLINELLTQYGGWMIAVVALIVFIESGVLFPVLPGDSLIFALGIFHREIPVPILVTVLVLILSAIAGNMVGYWIGKVAGRKLFKDDARFLSTANLLKAETFFNKYGRRSLVLARFVPFVRTFVPIVCGMANYRFRAFVTWNIVGAIAWIGVFLLAGEFLGQFDVIAKNIEVIAILIVAISVVPMIVEYVRRKIVQTTKKKSSH